MTKHAFLYTLLISLAVSSVHAEQPFRPTPSPSDPTGIVMPAENFPPPEVTKPLPAVVSEPRKLEDGLVALGTIRVDKAAGFFTVPGKVLRKNPPLEFLAVMKGGDKSYESLLELEVNALDFNLACILLGLKSDDAVRPEMHFDTKEVIGTAVDIEVSWQQGDKRHTVSAEDLLAHEGGPVEHAGWVYTGSDFSGDRYMAQVIGTLVGFVHSQGPIIEHRKGLGLGAYGAVGGNMALLPEVGAAVELRVSLIAPVVKDTSTEPGK